MDSATLIGFGGFALGMLGGMAHIVWMMSRMRAQLDRVIADLECDELAVVVQQHGERLARLEALHLKE